MDESPPPIVSPDHYDLTLQPAGHAAAWLHCAACDCITEVAGSYVDEAGFTRCCVCGTPILMGWDDGD